MTATLQIDNSELAERDSYRPARFSDALRSEWTKTRTIPSTVWTLLVAAVLGVGLSALFSALAAHAYVTDARNVRAVWDPTAMSTSGGVLAQLAIGVLGTLAVTSEYATHAIRGTLAAVPRRGRLLAAKTVVIGAIALVVGEVVMFLAFFLGQAVISGNAPTADLGQPGVLRAVVGCGFYVMVIGLLGVGLGTVLRSTAAAISTLVAIIYVLPGLAVALPASLQHTVEKFWPTQAGAQITTVVRAAHTLSPWAGFLDMCLFVAVVLGAGYWLLTRRDA